MQQISAAAARDDGGTSPQRIHACAGEPKCVSPDCARNKKFTWSEPIRSAHTALVFHQVSGVASFTRDDTRIQTAFSCTVAKCDTIRRLTSAPGTKLITYHLILVLCTHSQKVLDQEGRLLFSFVGLHRKNSYLVVVVGKQGTIAGVYWYLSVLCLWFAATSGPLPLICFIGLPIYMVCIPQFILNNLLE